MHRGSKTAHGSGATSTNRDLVTRPRTGISISAMDKSAEQMAGEYSILTYCFRVSVDGEEVVFQGAYGLHQSIEQKDGIGGWYQMPGQADAANITLQNGVFRGQSAFYDWISSISRNTVEKKDLTISLINESGSEVFMTWNVASAYPASISAPGLNATSKEAAIKELGLVAMKVSVKSP
ncbi:hypothetical protein EC968_004420 [Mortierella alpina]|nr:hypothetical protein EC968_004420 [Mortierella alpina]